MHFLQSTKNHLSKNIDKNNMDWNYIKKYEFTENLKKI